MQRAELSHDETLIKQHYVDQPHYGSHGAVAPMGYPGTPISGENFHPVQVEFTRFNNNIGAMTPDERELLKHDTNNFWQNYYNSTSLGVVRAFEGPSPRGERSEHVERFLKALLKNEIGAHIGAGNPMSGLISKTSIDELNVGNRGFFDITAIPENFMNPDEKWTVEQTFAAKSAYVARLEKNSEIRALIQAGYRHEKSLKAIINRLANDFFEILSYLKKIGMQITVTPTGGSEGAERYQVQITYEGQSQTIDYLALSLWDDFAGKLFSVEKIAELAAFYQANVNNAKFGVNCAAGLGRTGVVAMAFELLQNFTEYYDEKGVPNIARVDALLQKMRTNRPGIIQTPDQYTLAIALARQIHVYSQTELKQNFTFDKINEIYQQTQAAIVVYQRVYAEQMKRQEQQRSELSSTAIIRRIIPMRKADEDKLLRRTDSSCDSSEAIYVVNDDDSLSQLSKSGSASQLADSDYVETILQSAGDETNLFGPSTSAEQIKPFT